MSTSQQRAAQFWAQFWEQKSKVGALGGIGFGQAAHSSGIGGVHLLGFVSYISSALRGNVVQVTSAALEQLGRVSATYATMAVEYRAVAEAAAAAESAHKHARAKAILRYKASEDRMSMAEAEARAEADDEVAGLYTERLMTAAVADSYRQRLSQLREQTSVGRSFAAAERLGDEIHMRGATP